MTAGYACSAPRGLLHGELRQQVWVVLAAVVVLFLNLGGPALWDDDEPRNAQCAREMLDRGDWIVPTFNQQLRTDKPVLLYWLMFGAYTVLGATEFSARCCSAVLAVGTSLLTYHIGRKLFRAEVGFWAGLMVATSLMFVISGRAATPDSTLVFFTTLAMLLFVGMVAPAAQSGVLPPRAATETVPFSSDENWGSPPTYSSAGAKRGYGLVYAAMGMAVLAKGPVGVVLPMAVLLVYSVCRAKGPRREQRGTSWTIAMGRWCDPRLWLRALWSLRPLTAIVVLAVVVLPWYVCVGIQTDGQWLAGFLGKHNLERFLSPMETHRGPPIYYIPAILVGFFPWSVLLPLALWEMLRQICREAREPLCHGFAEATISSISRLGPWLCHSRGRRGQSPISSTACDSSQPRHRCETRWQGSYQFVAVWTAVYVGFFSLSATKLPSYVLPAYPAMAIITAAFLVRWLHDEVRVRRFWMPLALGILAAVGVVMLIGLPIAIHRILPGEELLGLVGLILLGGGGAGLVFLGRRQRRRVAIAMAVTAVAFAAMLFGVVSARIGGHQNNTAIIAFIHRCSPGDFQLCTFQYGVPGLVYYADRPVRQCDDACEVHEFFQQAEQPFLVTYADRLDQLKGHLPKDAVELFRQRRFLRRGDLVLIGRADSVAQNDLGER